MCMRGSLNWMSGSFKEAYMRYECGEHIWAKERATNQSKKFQNSKVTELTQLAGNKNKPSCRLLELFNKNLEKFTIFGLSKISAFLNLETFHKFSGLRKFLNYLDLEKISHCRT